MTRAILGQAEDIRRSGSAALDLAYVAAGRYDGYFEIGLKPWDMAAGVLLVHEAGGRYCDFAGRDGIPDSGNLIAGNLNVAKAHGRCHRPAGDAGAAQGLNRHVQKMKQGAARAPCFVSASVTSVTQHPAQERHGDPPLRRQ